VFDEAPPESLGTRLAAMRSERYAAGAALIAPDASPTHVFHLASGLVRQYALSANGEHYNLGFHGPGEWVFGRIVMGAGGPCCSDRAIGVEALQDSVAIRVSLADLARWRDEDRRIADYFTRALMAIASERLGREADLVQRPAQARYLELIAKRPDLVESVPQLQIAAWLGITPVALSRIRRRVREQGGSA